MHYAILPLIAALISPAAFSFYSPSVNVIVSFSNGAFEPDIVSNLGGKVIDVSERLGMVRASIPESRYSALENDPHVEFVDYDRTISLASADSTGSAEYSKSWGAEAIGADKAHESGFTGKGVKIAVLDTGVDYNHPQLRAAYRGGYDFINGDNDPMDDNGHGTHVAGIIAGARDGIGIVGVAPDAQIYAIKVSDSNGKGSFGGLVDGIEWAIDHGMNIVTMSITGTGGTNALQKAIKVAYYQYGIVLVAAVGNDGTGDVLYPAAYDEVIGVGSVTKNNEKSSFSRTGDQVELVAPGSEIESAAIGGGYRYLSGTSMATPFVTGAVALLIGSDETLWNGTGWVNGDGTWTPDEVRQVLKSTAVDLGSKGLDEEFGSGLVQLDFPAQVQGQEIVGEINNADQALWARFLLSIA